MINFRENSDSGIWERIFPDRRVKVIPEILSASFLRLNHYPVTMGHAGGRNMCTTMRNTYYWPGMALECYNPVRGCPECAKERVKLQKYARPLKLFPPSALLEDVHMDFLEELTPTTRGKHRYLLVIVDRFAKLIRCIPLRKLSHGR